jgi:hypothetical protein
MGYRIEGYTSTTEVQGGTKLVKVRQWHVYALPSETYFQFRRPATTAKDVVHSVADQLATRIEAVLAIPAVTDVVYAQDVTPGGQLVDTMTTYYEAHGGNILGSVESNLAHFGPTFTGKQVAAEIAAGGDFLA